MQAIIDGYEIPHPDGAKSISDYSPEAATVDDYERAVAADAKWPAAGWADQVLELLICAVGAR